MTSNLAQQLELNKNLVDRQQTLRTRYDDAIKVHQDGVQRQNELKAEITQLHESILRLCPEKQLPSLESIMNPTMPLPASIKLMPSPAPTLSSTPPPQLITNRTMTVPTAAALKMGVGFPLNSLHKDETGRILSTQRISNDDLMNSCGICKKITDQHLLAKCDTCHLHYHLGCLSPPLTRHPKRSKLYAWQCSECDNSDDPTTGNVIIPKGPRKSRVRYNKDGRIMSDSLRDSFGSEKSKKSDESHHKTFNGSETELRSDMLEKIPDVEDIIGHSIVPTTSTPIIDSKSQPQVTSNKRGRKPKPKVDESLVMTEPEKSKKKAKAKKVVDLDSSSPIDLSSPEPPARKLKARSNSSLDSTPEKPQKKGKSKPVKQATPAVTKEDNEIAPIQQQLIVNNLETIVLEPPQEVPKIPKKGRPRKEKTTINQLLSKVQEKQEMSLFPEVIQEPHPEKLEPKPEDTVFSINNASVDISQFRPFANSIPTFDLPKQDVNFECFPALKHESLPLNGTVVNGEGTASSGSGHHKHKKQKKHKRRHSNSPSSGDRQTSTKKQKKKKKEKSHTVEGAGMASFEFERSPEQPRIKMKFCANYVQAGDDKKIMWSLPTATTGEIPETLASPEMYSNGGQQFIAPPMGNGHGKVIKMIKKRKTTAQRAALAQAKIDANQTKKPEPKKRISASVIAPSHFTTASTSVPTSPELPAAVLSMSLPLPSQICDVCQTPGSNQNLVK